MLGWLNVLQRFREHYTKERISFKEQEEAARAQEETCRKSVVCISKQVKAVF